MSTTNDSSANSSAQALTLLHPIKLGESYLEAVTFRTPDVASLRGLEMFSILRMDVSAHRKLVPRISDLSESSFDQLSPPDLLAVQNKVTDFFVTS